MFERFTDNAKQVLVTAGEFASEERSPAIRRHHMLVGLLDDAAERPDGPPAQVFAAAAVDPSALRSELVTSLRQSETPVEGGAGKRPFSSGAKKALELALREALSLGHNYIGCEHLLLAILRSADGPLERTLATTGLQYGTAREFVRTSGPYRARRGRGGRIKKGRGTEGFEAVIRRATTRALNERPATTGDLLVALAEVPGTHFKSILADVELPDPTALAAAADDKIASGKDDGPSNAVRVDPDTGAVTVHDPELATALRGALDQGESPRDALRSLLVKLGLIDEE
ncbi:MAG: ATP-dependent Clp protease ATP-binding subunit ClpC [Actinomycetota bacterium]